MLIGACLITNILNLYSLAAQYIPLAKGQAQPSTNPNVNPETGHLDNWLLYQFGKMQDEQSGTVGD